MANPCSRSMNMPFPRHVLLLTSLLLVTGAPAYAQSADEGDAIFKSKCTACHTIGGGKLVGPDLKGVTARREAGWLKRQMVDPLGLINAGDPIAVQLVKDMNGVMMVPLGLSDQDVDAVIAFLRRSDGTGSAARGLPWQYLPTLAIGMVAALALTGVALRVGKKRVDVR